MLGVQRDSRFFSWTPLPPNQDLLNFENSLKSQLVESFPDKQEHDLINEFWIDIRDQACRNAGLSSWGEHVLHQQDSLKSALNNVIAAIDPIGYKPWPQGNHEDRLSEILEHIFYSKPTLPELTWEELKALFVEHNPGLMAQAREQLEKVFPRLLTQINNKTHPDEVTEALVDHVIGVYAFMQPQDGSGVKFLQKIDDSWQLVTYQIKRILMTDTTLATPVYAYGCMPEGNNAANPLLLYRGTTYRSQDGALLSYMADVTPMHSVGELIYKQGKDAVALFINQSNNKPVHIYGNSLGGALAVLTGEDFPDKTVIHAHAAPGKLPCTTSRITGKNIYHDSDIVVPTLGFFNEKITLYKTMTKENGTCKNRNFHKAHVLPAAGTAPTLILRVTPKYENERLFRTIWTIFHQAISLILFTVLTVHLLVKYVFNQILLSLAEKYAPNQEFVV